jgi:UDP-GlcNAc:undecaprenyl-phosphate/decaprenyl-phosphate GlcNAc-1-phosphate transferase
MIEFIGFEYSGTTLDFGSDYRLVWPVPRSVGRSVGHPVRPSVIALLLAPFLALCVTAISLHIMLRTRLIHATSDEPNERSLHHGAIPRIGGLGIALGLMAALLTTLLTTLIASSSTALIASQPTTSVTWTIVTCYGVLLIVSLFDDVYRLKVAPRLLLHCAVAVGCTFNLGLSGIALGLIALLLVWSANLYNFMDGSDGLAGGMTIVGFGTYGLIAALNAHLELAVICASIAGAAIAFLRFNFHPARLFLGDSGSIPLGFTAGAVGVIGWQQACWPAWLPVILFFPFIFDATFTLLSRVLKRKAFWQAHREHIYQQRILAGLGHRKLALWAYLLMLISAALALLIIHQNSTYAGLIIALQTVTGLFFARRSTNTQSS